MRREPHVGGEMFREPLRRDPLVVGWALFMLTGAIAALAANTEWSGDLEGDRVVGFLKDVTEVFLWSFFVLLFLAWLRAKGWRDRGPRYAKRTDDGGRESTLPWTDRWISDTRQADAERRENVTEPAEPPVVTCRHGVRAGEQPPVEQAPVLRALSVSHNIVRPGSSISVTWCFEHAADVVVDGRRGYPACGEALVRIDRSRAVEVIGRNRHVSTPVATSTVVATAVPQLDLPTVSAPPPVALHMDVAATVGAGAPIAARLDALWAAQDRLRPRTPAPAGLVGVPASLRARFHRPEETR
ncbi:hypothetical protein [Blastococcus sp. SYSU D00813]